MEDRFSLINKTRGNLPFLPLQKIKDEILGKNYCLSVAFVDKKQSKKINKEYRNINKPTNILSFVLNKKKGEIIICPSVARQEAKDFDKNFEHFLGFLVIHGMLHLDGMKHSSTMEKAEEKYDKKYFRRNRCGVVHDSCCGRRIFKGRKES